MQEIATEKTREKERNRKIEAKVGKARKRRRERTKERVRERKNERETEIVKSKRGVEGKRRPRENTTRRKRRNGRKNIGNRESGAGDMQTKSAREFVFKVKKRGNEGDIKRNEERKRGEFTGGSDRGRRREKNMKKPKVMLFLLLVSLHKYH